MATEIRPAQRSVPNIVLDSSLNHSPSQTDSNARPTTPNTPVVLLAKPRQQTHPSMTVVDSASSTLLPRPLSAPTSLVSSPSTSSAPVLPISAMSGPVSPSPANSANPGGTQQEIDVDPQIVEALKSSKDRLYVLKLGETMENLINQGTLYAKVDLQPASSYQRLLVHRCATFYRLTQESSHSTIAVTVTPDSRIPSKRIADLVPPEESILPAFQIMRRTDRTKATSRTTSVDGNVTDEGNESGRSQGSGSKKNKKYMTIEEREAAYHEARSRIFMGFDEKDAASSGGALSSAASTVSYTGGSTGMSSSVDGDGASTAPTESEYSGPIGRGLGSGKDSRYSSTSTNGSFSGSNGRGKQTNSGGGSANSTLRSSAPPFSGPNGTPPPMGTVHYIPMHDTNMNLHGQTQPPSQQQQQSQQPASGAPPPAGFAPYAPPTMYPYYVPYFYPYPYPPPPLATHPPTVHSNQPPQDGPTENQTPPQPQHQQGQVQGQQSQNQQQAGPVPQGYAPHLVPAPPPPTFPGGYMWLPAPTGYVPVQPPGSAQGSSGPQGQPQSQPPQQPQNPAASMNMQSNQGPPNISRPASQGSHQGHRPPGQNMQNQNAPQSSYGPFQGPPNAFQGPHQQPPPHHLNQGPSAMNNLANRASAPPMPMIHNNAPQPGFGSPTGTHMQQPGGVFGPGPGPTGYGQHGPIGGARTAGPGPMFNQQPPQQGNGPWNPQAGVGPGHNANLSGLVNNSAAGGAAGPKRNMARAPWGSYSYGPGIGGPSGLVANTTSPRNVPNPLSPMGGGPIGLAGPILRPPEELNIRVMPRITLETHSTGSSNGSSGSLRKRNAAHGGATVTGAKGDETSSVTSSSSSSSKRTYTSNASSQPPQHHPLPERPDWVMNARMQSGHNALPHRGRGVASTSSSNSSVSRPSQQGSSSTLGSSSNLSSLTTQTNSSNSSSASLSTDAMVNDFPPLGGANDSRISSATTPSTAGTSGTTTGQGQGSSRARTPATGVWNTPAAGTWSGNSLPQGVSGLPPRPNFGNASEPQSSNPRLDESDKKFERPPPKTGAALFDPRLQTPKSRSQSRDRLDGGVKGITQGVAALSVAVPGTQSNTVNHKDDDQNQTPAPKTREGATTNNENTAAATESSSPASGSSCAATDGGASTS